MRTVTSCVLLLALGATAFADDDPPPPLWTGQVSASYVANAGNTNNATIGASGELAWQPSQYRIVATGEFIRTETEHQLGSKRLGTAVRIERTLPWRLSMYTEGAYFEDTPSGTRNQLAVNIGGLGHVLKGEKHALAVSLSLTQTWENRMIMPDRDFLGGQFGVDFNLKTNDIVLFEQTASYVRDFSDSTNWRVKASSAMTVSLNKRFAFKFSHQLYRNKPDPGKRSTDRTTLASLVIRWPSGHSK